MSPDRRSTLALACAPAALALALAWAPAAAAQSMPLAIDPLGGDGPYDVWMLAEVSGELTPGPAEVEFKSIRLVGYPRADRLRLDRPAWIEGGEIAAERLRLPAGGALYRVGTPDGTAVLHVDSTGQVSMPLELAFEGNALLPALHVSTDGVLALAATSPAAGGDVWLLDLESGASATCLTEGLPPLAIEPASLRVAPGVAWFVVGGQLHRADLAAGTPAQPVDLGLPELAVQPELAGAAHDGRIAAVLGDDPAARRLVSVSADGQATLLTPAPASVLLPGYDHPLGPRLTLSPDGAVTAWTQLENGSLELFLEELGPAPQQLHVTSAPEFPAYIDNVGVLGFQADRRLLFLTGDTTLAGLIGFDTIGAGEMFAVDLTTPGAPVYVNVSQTGGGYEPPYLEPATLSLTEALFDPMAQHCVVSGGLGMALASFPLYPHPEGDNVVTHLLAVEHSPSIQPLGDRLLVASEPEDGGYDGHDGHGPEIELDLGVLSLGDPELPGFSTLLSLPEGIDVDRLVTDDDGAWMSFVATLDSGLQVPVLLSVDSAQLQIPTWPLLVSVAGPPAFSSTGRLYFAIGDDDGLTKLVSALPGQAAQLVPAPQGRGFPLAY